MSEDELVKACQQRLYELMGSPESVGPGQFHGLDVNVVTALDAYYLSGGEIRGGSFADALLEQDWKKALMTGHQHLSRLSIIRHMEYAAGLIEKHR